MTRRSKRKSAAKSKKSLEECVPGEMDESLLDESGESQEEPTEDEPSSSQEDTAGTQEETEKSIGDEIGQVDEEKGGDADKDVAQEESPEKESEVTSVLAQVDKSENDASEEMEVDAEAAGDKVSTKHAPCIGDDDENKEVVETSETHKAVEKLPDPPKDTDESEDVQIKEDNAKMVDAIDLTKSDEDDGMELGEEDEEEEVEKEQAQNYVIPDYDDPTVLELEIDPEQHGKGKVKESDDFVRYWRAVVDNPQEFSSWTYLLQYVEQEGKLPLARRAYNSFFCRYPLCYGYWKKFSELERKNGNLLRAQKILERGVRAIPLSIDLWIHVLDFYMTHYNQPDAGIDKTRTIFKRAITAAGEEFRSEKLWNKYIKWEMENKTWMEVMAIYEKALQTQTQHYSIIFNDFKEFVNSHSPTDLMIPDDFQKALVTVREGIAAKALAKSDEKGEQSKETDEGNGNDMDEAPPGVEDHEKPPNDDELKAVKQMIIKEKKKLYDVTEQNVTKIWAFEEGVKRPYFHVKQLERAQLKNWREYLDMEIAKGDEHRIVLLFERCLIACALYEDFWLKYAKYMAQSDNEKARKIYKRACYTHLPKKPNIHMQWAAHEEVLGNRETASKILEKLDNIVPGMAMIKMRRVAVERRSGNIQVAEDLLRCYVASAVKDKEEVFYTRKLAWYLLKISDKKEEAKRLLKDLIPKYKSELKLYNDLVELEFQCAGHDNPADENAEVLAMEAFDIALSSEKLTDDQKFNFSQRKLEYLEDFGCDVKRLQKVYDEHQKLVRSQKKRTQIDLTNEDTPAKKAKTEAAAISVVGTSTAHMSNGSRYTSSSSSSSTAASTYATQQATYSSGDPSMYYQQQQNYWNYQKPTDAQQQYNYNQWSQYYSGQR
ncbi:pre-mRNA-processing factor 39-like [Clavelina lepadiformis]|uniref:pre-mRNA-processing factor 39-like n=1 Tax=Clavelina lepadiformis TaxID=159417 RepID=UPI004042BAA4